LVTDLSRFLPAPRGRIRRDGERRVSVGAELWFRNGARAFCGGETAEPAINRKFTANPFGGIFRKFFAS
jgi:hypothetical protein